MTSSTRWNRQGQPSGTTCRTAKEPPGVWAGKAAEAFGLTGLVDPEQYRQLFGKLVAPTGERLYSGGPPRYAAGTGRDRDEEADAAVAALSPFATRPRSGPCWSAPCTTARTPASSATAPARWRRCSPSMTTAAANPTCMWTEGERTDTPRTAPYDSAQ